ncbi:hypothetical protein [Streptomyces chartreusis]|uniref:hypothetical protein n=1 Tax=Streptomyces chartreusis TaxID=1969 RepID=UPI002E820490|nr:hypothetical protein [Streptomyces chartreusis]WUB23811.1 hypothetical protein OG997_44560 [Streptomyces chartreusis]
MTTPEEQPNNLEAALARARTFSKMIAAALGEDLERDEPLAWQPIWKRPRKRRKKGELLKQQRRLRDAGRRRLAAGQSRRPRSRQNRIGNAAARRDARALSRVRHSNAWVG